MVRKLEDLMRKQKEILDKSIDRATDGGDDDDDGNRKR